MAQLKISQDVFNLLHPVGSVYISMTSTSPETLFANFGVTSEWTQVSGRFLYCTTTSKTTGGSQTTSSISTTLSGKSSGNTGSHTLTVSELPTHTHSGTTGSGGAHSHQVFLNGDSNFPMVGYPGWNGGTTTSYGVTMKTSCTGFNMIANSAGSHTHTFTTGSTGSGSGHVHPLNDHTHNISHTHGLPLPPYITCYCWYRTS